MIEQLKVALQSAFSEIEGIGTGVSKLDDIIENHEVYYGYEITYQMTNSTIDYSFSDYNISITGRLVGRNVDLSTMDNYSQKIADVLKKFRFRYTIQDVTKDGEISKKIINGNCSMNEVNYLLR